ncbi:nicotinamide-nucleotide amidohydrolase family protein [Sediminicoccus sp. KRV36]|uniref:CinA family protein n=1 Tax=Sediminicoccus sp. KRV36 TaxID=3133721 RepID=UPI00200D27AD|nr:nicotinamide-nucleotide amidohydrolase family protein [Sediminicoccus rosea]UPY36092.1 nicotinamide-nucleotide amidohydrolase family protein [Sediminicoccus rosea]
MLPESTLAEAAALLAALQARHLTIATAESCTGGLIAAALTAIPGSSASVLAGFVTYSNEAKTSMLGVPAEMIERFGAVSEEVARRMVEGALRASGAQIVLACTGVAGPGGGSLTKPVGLVWMGVGQRGGAITTEHRIFPGDRAAIRAETVRHSFAMAHSLLA